MCFSQFFGDQSPFQIIVAVVAFVTAIYTFYKSFLEKAKLAVYPGDRMTLVLSGGGGVRKFQLRMNLVNKAVKMGTLHRLEAEVRNSAGEVQRFEWRLFFEYAPGGQAVQPATDPYPVSMIGKSSFPLFAEFEAVGAKGVPRWPQGRWEVRLIGWVNKQSRQEAPNLESVFHIDLSGELATRLADERPAGAMLVHVSIVEWSTGGAGAA